MSAQNILEVRDLTVHFPTHDGTVRAVDGISYDLRAGETLGIVGESGSGKSVSSLAVMGLLPKTAQVTGSIRFRGEDVTQLPTDERAARGITDGVVRLSVGLEGEGDLRDDLGTVFVGRASAGELFLPQLGRRPVLQQQVRDALARTDREFVHPVEFLQQALGALTGGTEFGDLEQRRSARPAHLLDDAEQFVTTREGAGHRYAGPGRVAERA